MAAQRAWSVSALLLAVSDALSARFGGVAVTGELSGFTRASSGHCYFMLKDAAGAAAGLRCALFRRSAQALSFQPRDGQQVEVRGRLVVYEARGELQLIVESLRPLGAGNLYEEFLRLKALLEAQGCFDSARKRPWPRFPRTLGVITSTAGAALHDVLTTLRRRAPQVSVVIYPSLVQGPEAPGQLVAALTQAAQRAECDGLLLCRGGGSIEDLWAFNDERVVRAILASRVPVMSGVGHETDVTLADLAADVRAATPTAAAELASPTQAEALEQLRMLSAAMSRRMVTRLDAAAQGLDNVSLRLQRPSRWLAGQQGRLAALAGRSAAAASRALQQRPLQLQARQQTLRQTMRADLRQRQTGLQLLAERLRALDPKAVMARGYAWIEGSDGRPVLGAQALRPGMGLRALWTDGEALATVEAVRILTEGRPEGVSAGDEAVVSGGAAAEAPDQPRS